MLSYQKQIKFPLKIVLRNDQNWLDSLAYPFNSVRSVWLSLWAACATIWIIGDEVTSSCWTLLLHWHQFTQRPPWSITILTKRSQFCSRWEIQFSLSCSSFHLNNWLSSWTKFSIKIGPCMSHLFFLTVCGFHHQVHFWDKLCEKLERKGWQVINIHLTPVGLNLTDLEEEEDRRI